MVKEGAAPAYRQERREGAHGRGIMNEHGTEVPPTTGCEAIVAQAPRK